MGCPEKMRSSCTGSDNRSLAEQNITTNISWRFEVKLAVEVAVISNLMSFTHCTMHEVRPALGVSAENEERRFHPVFSERVKNSRRRIRIRTVVKCERDLFLFGGEMTKHRSEDEAVSMKCAVYRATDDAEAECCREDHVDFFAPSTPA